MYGLVNRAIEDMALKSGGEEVWNQIRKKAGFEDPTFLSMQSYPDQVTFNLVEAASEVFNKPAGDILRSFGRHWILFTAREGYGDLMDITGSDLKTFFSNLNHMHCRGCSDDAGTYASLVFCRRGRRGTFTDPLSHETQRAQPDGPRALEGLTERFNVEADVVQTHYVEGGSDHDIFEIRPK